MIEELIRSRDTEALLQMVCKEWNDYQPEAIEIAKNELDKRNIQYQQQILHIDTIIQKKQNNSSARTKRHLFTILILLAIPLEVWVLSLTGLSEKIIVNAILAGTIAGIAGIWAKYKPLI